MTQEWLMHRCLQLAVLGQGKVAPNPLVGSVVVYRDKIIGEGYHQYYGGPHAEVNAIASAENFLKQHGYNQWPSDVTLYVNLEPCTHYGKTPPCTDLIIKKQIKRVVIAHHDPNPIVTGKGIEKMRQAGIDVIAGVAEKDAMALNIRFFTFHWCKRPYIILKWAQTLDGYMAKSANEPIWITGSMAKRVVHRWRSEEQGILVGKNTVMADNPRLNNRYFAPDQQPIRMIIDRNLRVAGSYHVLDNSQQTFIFNSLTEKTIGKTEWIKLPFKEVALELCEVLYERNIQSLIVEGGAHTLSTFINLGVWDEARVFIGNKWLGNGLKAPVLPDKVQGCEKLGDDVLLLFRNKPLPVWLHGKD